MSAAAIEHEYRYAEASRLARLESSGALQLATSGGVTPNPHFFEGRLVKPRRTALALRALSRVAGERFFIPPNVLERILAAADPVVTSGGGYLRFEAFSACCSAYARVDLPPEALDGDVVSHGTTNVDFNAGMRAALAQVGDHEDMGLAVGADEVVLRRNGGEVVERRVPLPLRWLKSFVEMQAFQSRMEPRVRLDRAETLRFLRSLPAGGSARTELWAVPTARGLRLTGTRDPKGVRITGVARLRLLEPMVAEASSLAVHATPEGDAAEWVLSLGPVRFHLATSAETWRGFSGEGQVLRALVEDVDPGAIAAVRGQLRWQAMIAPRELETATRLQAPAVESALAALGTRGLVGYDVALGARFHRELPFDLAGVEDLHPRLRAARRLIDEGRVRRRDGDPREADVDGSDVTHRVSLASGGTCTCTWHAKHQGRRGECKHLLALRLLREAE